MLSDRTYMRDENPNAALKPLAWVIGGLIGTYILENLLLVALRKTPEIFWAWSAFSFESLSHGRVWTLLTHPLLHSPIESPLGILHLAGSCLAIFFFGRPVLERLGVRRFFGSLAAMVCGGAALWFAVHYNRGDFLIGAGAISSGLLALWALLFANQRSTILLFFVLPVTIVPKYIGLISAALTVIFFLFAELFGTGANMNHSAHLGGMAAALIIYRWVRSAGEDDEPEQEAVELPRWLKKRKSAGEPAGNFKLNLPPNRADLKAEVDRILDKINTSGFGSLTPEEKRTLDEARDLLSKR